MVKIYLITMIFCIIDLFVVIYLVLYLNPFVQVMLGENFMKQIIISEKNNYKWNT